MDSDWNAPLCGPNVLPRASRSRANNRRRGVDLKVYLHQEEEEGRACFVKRQLVPE